MKRLGLLIYLLNQDFPGKNGLLVIRAYKEILKVIENDINNRGGICGVQLKIHCLILERGNYVNEVTKFILRNDDIICCHGTVNLEDSLREKGVLEKNKIVFFKSTYRKSGELKHIKDTNTFMEMRSSQKAKILQIMYLIDKFNDKGNVFFIHAGKKNLASPIYDDDFNKFAVKNKFHKLYQ